MLRQFATEADGLLAAQQKQRTEAQKGLQTSMLLVEQHLGRQVDAAIDPVIAVQQQIQDECIATAKCAIQLHQKTIRWKAEHKRLRAQLDDLKDFEAWVRLTEVNMHEICGKLEYVCHELTRASKEEAS
ncbi:hypothetical protein THRCLA_22829 [Thraustotheca clavata]|uniref:Uncharacterized protein n=1 Tax=Thraustotheca clavata TaxID=74557 RepID=A0A1V9YS32_9STRA|nr:hypothetical protein THRCLA_22829 [Thraustotheca clavata]